MSNAPSVAAGLAVLILAFSSSVATAQTTPTAWRVSRNSANQLQLDFSFSVPHTLAQVIPPFTGWLDNAIPFKEVVTAIPANDIYPIGVGTQIAVEIGSHPPEFTMRSETNTSWFLPGQRNLIGVGGTGFEYYPWLGLNSSAATFNPNQNVWEITFRIVDLSGAHEPSPWYDPGVRARRPLEGAYTGDKVEYLSRIAGGGNDCWGYVSASGREYAIKGTLSGTYFYEITDPYDPVEIAVIPHGSHKSDIKTYKDHAYIVAEASGTGIQVVDLSDIDNGIITHTKTLVEVGRSHNLAIDTDSGFLYTISSNETTGTTTCWDLSDPSDPKRVGALSMTAAPQHDAQVVTYTSGPYAGKQILFGFARLYGLEIYDVTSKNSPFLISRSTYPGIAHCHQGWLSEDRKYLYIDDEYDELATGDPTRTMIFDVSDLSRPVYVKSFSTGLYSSDHNLYIRDGFLFEANYTSGVRIFDACDPVNPVEVGWFDTYPEDDYVGHLGAWTAYPYFPSGRILVNDTKHGLFVLDAVEATATPCGACYPDCDQTTGVGVLDIFDFLCFQDSFVSGNTYACDCDTSTGAGVCDIFDFLCFQDAFVAGCP